jgi:proteic killer suppression protein
VLVITSFADDTTRDVYDGKSTKAARRIPKTLWGVTRRKLDALEYAKDLRDLGSPGNKLEKLQGDLAGKHSIRVNDQYRIVLAFDEGQASDVLITDYH